MRNHVIALLLAVASFAAASVSGVAQDGAPQSTIDKVRERGFLICGAAGEVPGFAAKNEEGNWSGFDVDLCRALATAALGDPNLVEFRALNGNARFVDLQLGNVDVLVRNGSWTMGREIEFGVRQITTTFFDGLSFMVPNASGFVSAYVLKDISVCVVERGTDRQRVRDFFFEIQADFSLRTYEEYGDLAQAYAANLCDAVAAPVSKLQAFRRQLDDPGQHRILPERLTKRALGPVVKQGDPSWENLIRQTIWVMIIAEELGVTSQNYTSMQASRTPEIRRLLGVEGEGESELFHPDWAKNIISLVGNYREIYERNFGAQTGADLQRGQNSLWSQGGLLYAPSLWRQSAD